MQKDAHEIATQLVERLQNHNNDRVLVGLSGIPGAGKSIFSSILLQNINQLLNNESTVVVVGLDGWHLSRALLDTMPDPKLAHERRGIHWTFDAQGYVDFVFKLRQETSSVITAPSFSHAAKDPVPDAISIYPHHRIVIIEGLYVSLDVDPWSKAAALLDYRFFIHVDFEAAKARLAKRHLVSGITQTLEDGIRRAEQNDLPNGTFIIENMLKPTRIIESIQDPHLLL